MGNSNTGFNRRSILRGISGILLAGALVGCSGPGGEEDDESDEEDGGGEQEEGEGEEGDLRQPVAE